MSSTYNAPAQRRYRERQRDTRDLVRVSVWVPADTRERVVELAAELRTLRKRRHS